MLHWVITLKTPQWGIIQQPHWESHRKKAHAVRQLQRMHSEATSLIILSLSLYPLCVNQQQIWFLILPRGSSSMLAMLANILISAANWCSLHNNIRKTQISISKIKGNYYPLDQQYVTWVTWLLYEICFLNNSIQDGLKYEKQHNRCHIGKQILLWFSKALLW